MMTMSPTEMAKKNHTLDALGEIRELVEGFPDDVDMEGDRFDDGGSHTKNEAREVVSCLVDRMIQDLAQEKERILKKYK